MKVAVYTTKTERKGREQEERKKKETDDARGGLEEAAAANAGDGEEKKRRKVNKLEAGLSLFLSLSMASSFRAGF